MLKQAGLTCMASCPMQVDARRSHATVAHPLGSRLPEWAKLPATMGLLSEGSRLENKDAWQLKRMFDTYLLPLWGLTAEQEEAGEADAGGCGQSVALRTRPVGKAHAAISVARTMLTSIVVLTSRALQPSVLCRQVQCVRDMPTDCSRSVQPAHAARAALCLHDGARFPVASTPVSKSAPVCLV